MDWIGLKHSMKILTTKYKFSCSKKLLTRCCSRDVIVVVVVVVFVAFVLLLLLSLTLFAVIFEFHMKILFYSVLLASLNS